MIYTKQTKKAIRLMFDKQKNQVDKDGIPYVFHPWHVAESMNDEKRTIVALLHDIIEDTNVTVEDLQGLGFENDVIDAIVCMTHKQDEDYFEYIKRIGTNEIAIDVKLKDLEHNMDKTRLSVITPKYVQKYKKYEKSVEYLIQRKILNDDN